MTLLRTLTVLCAGLAIAACSKEKAEDKPAAKTPAAKTANANAKAPATVPAGQTAAIDAVMAHYETCRAELAADKSKGVSVCARAMGEAAEKAAGAVADAVKPHAQAVAAAANKLAGSKADDIEALRLAYGEVSKLIVAMLTAAPEAAKKYRVFECPMAKGYNRWAQVDAKMANPYMGAKMLECGFEVHDHHTGNTDHSK